MHVFRECMIINLIQTMYLEEMKYDYLMRHQALSFALDVADNRRHIEYCIFSGLVIYWIVKSAEPATWENTTLRLLLILAYNSLSMCCLCCQLSGGGWGDTWSATEWCGGSAACVVAECVPGARRHQGVRPTGCRYHMQSSYEGNKRKGWIPVVCFATSVSVYVYVCMYVQVEKFVCQSW